MARDRALIPALPIDDVLPALRAALIEHAAVVLQAPPGAGKTTRVPLALLDAPWLDGRRILMLEPRRIAARAAARRMAAALGETVGATVGFRVRGESRVGASTRIEVVTEGVLTRMLIEDATLDRVGVVLFDEFHERSLQADFGLALTLRTQELLRPQLRILVMSATLDGAGVSAVLGGAPIVSSDGRRHAVEIRHVVAREDARVEDAVASAIRGALAADHGSVLAFLPGVGEIRRCASLLDRAGLSSDVRVLPLFGDLAPAAQDAAIAPPAPGVRKVVLATSIAETSLTIDGVRIVVDGGLSRVPRFSPRTGMTRLETTRVSRSAADQRAGRAGRTAPGICYRLWSTDVDAHLLEGARPEILDADLAPLMLDLAMAGVDDVAELRWMDAPPAAGVSQARALLRQLGALDVRDRVTAHGTSMAALALHPRLAHMLLRARDVGLGATACVIAALLEERDVLGRDAAQRDVDLRSRVAILAGSERDLGSDVDRDALRRVRAQAQVWRGHLRIAHVERVDEGATGRILAHAYPDRVAQWRGGAGNRYLLRNGTGAVLSDPGVLASAPYLAIADLDGRSPQSRIYLAAPIDRAELEEIFSADFEREDVVEWSSSAGVVHALCRERLGAIVLREAPLREIDPVAVGRVLMEAIAKGDGLSLPWTDAARRVRERVAFLRTLDERWPDLSESALLSSMEQWLLPHLGGSRRREDVERLSLSTLLLAALTWEQRQQLDVLAPTHVTVPTGSRIAIDYGDSQSPVLAVRLQEMFGLADTPHVGGGRVPLTLHLLSPAHRPVQVTRDLAGFWRSSYFAVRKDLRGRYPKHEWPEDPMSAAPTRRVKPRS